MKIKNKIKLVFLILLIFGLPRSGLSKNSLLSFELDEGKLQFPISLTERIESLSKFKIDRYNNDFARAPIYSSQIRTGLHYNSKKQFDDFKIELELEADVLTGVHQGKIKDEAAYVPDTQDLKNQIRKAYLGFSYSNILHGKFGFNTSDWGMGLIANGGSRRAKEGSALFLDPRGGDLVLRALLAYGPFTDGSILIGFAADKVQNDGALYEGDTAYQFAGSVIYGFLKENSMGFYAAKRQQETENGLKLDALVFDFYLKAQMKVLDSFELQLESESAFITGESELGGNSDFETQKLRQWAWAFKAKIAKNNYGFILDFLAASGDENYYDDKQNGFKADENYQLGFVFHRYVIASQSSATAKAASDPDLSGYPPRDIDRFPTKGQITNSLNIFPRAYYILEKKFEIYAGPLFIFGVSNLVDPFNSKIEGESKSFRNASPESKFFGTEYDLGLAYRDNLDELSLNIKLEYGFFKPGQVFEDADGVAMKEISAGRLIIHLNF